MMRSTATLPISSFGALALLEPGLRAWFDFRFPCGPTAGQRLAWPAILQGEHVLLSAPTGNGKTLAALVPLWQRLLLEEDETPGVRCLYVAPLRALCNDLYLRINDDLDQLKAWVGPEAWKLSAGVRTGDITPTQKRKLIDHPRSLLITTPESLSLLLAHPQAPRLLAKVRSVVIDEVHALAPNKRGADLAISLERLAHLTEKEPQRIGLSATCAPMMAVAGWLGGTGRTVTTVSVTDRRAWNLEIVDLTQAAQECAFLPTLLNHLQGLAERHQTLLIFTNVRSLSERIAWSLRRRLPHLASQIAVHHGSIAKETRHEVENDLQQGRLRVVLSSTSLELGIDIGCIDHVAFVHAPGGAARLLQRLGRGGHRPDGLRCGTVFVGSKLELLEAVSTQAAGRDGYLEPVNIPAHPLDVLCQQLIGMAVGKHLMVKRAWELVRAAYPFRDLTLGDFSSCLEYLTGGSVQTEVPARLRIRADTLRTATPLTPRLFRTNAGTIQEEPHKVVRREQDESIIGTIPDDFGDRLLTGDRFLLGGRTYELIRHERATVFVEEAGGLPTFTRWHGHLWSIPAALAQRIWHLRIRLGEALVEQDGAEEMLRDEYHVEEFQTSELCAYVGRQHEVSEVPQGGLLVEATVSEDGEHVHYAFHLPLAAAACEGIARVLSWRIRPAGFFPLEPGPLGFMVSLPAEIELTPERLRDLLNPEGYVDDLDRATTSSPVLAKRFMEAAHTGMMLLRTPIRGKPRKVGGSKWGSGRLLHWLRFSDRTFPLLLQAQREVREDYYQSAAALVFLKKLLNEEIRLRWLNEPSPFASEWLSQGGRIATPGANNLSELLLGLSTQKEVLYVA